MTNPPLFRIALAVAALALMPHATALRADTADPLVTACLSQLALTQTVCDCIAASADEKLSETQRRYVVAELNGDAAATSRLEDEMSDADVFAVGDWMDNAPAMCEFD